MGVQVDYEVLQAARMTQEEWLIHMGYQPKPMSAPPPSPPPGRSMGHLDRVRHPDFEEHLAIEELARFLEIDTQELAAQLGYTPYELDESLYDSDGRYVEDRRLRAISMIPVRAATPSLKRSLYIEAGTRLMLPR